MFTIFFLLVYIFKIFYIIFTFGSLVPNLVPPAALRIKPAHTSFGNERLNHCTRQWSYYVCINIYIKVLLFKVRKAMT